MIIEGHKTPLILVVDDDWMNREVIEAHLRGAGFDVMVVHSGEQALETVRQYRPDLVLLDVRMQGMSGYEVCQHLKAQDITQAVPVMMVTALENDEDKARAISAGADDFISKPFTSLILLTRVKNLLHMKYLQDELQARDRLLRQVLGRYVGDQLVEQILAELKNG